MLSMKISQRKNPEVDDLLPCVMIDRSRFTSETRALGVSNISASNLLEENRQSN
jgi:hypothetical protein